MQPILADTVIYEGYFPLTTTNFQLTILQNLNFEPFSCTGEFDDRFRPCFSCESFQAKQIYGSDYFNDIERSFTSRQTGENFQATRQSRRLICRGGRANCRLRVSRGVQLRQRSYARALEFVQSEQYLSHPDRE